MLAVDAWWALIGLTVYGLAVETAPADRGGLQYLLVLGARVDPARDCNC